LVVVDRAAGQRQDAVCTVDPTALDQHGAFQLVLFDLGMAYGHRTLEGIDPTAQGRRALRLVVVDRAAGQRQNAVFTVDPAALGQHGAFHLVLFDLGMAYGHRTLEGIDPTAQGRRALRLVVVDRAAGQRQNAVFTVDPTA